MKRLLASSALSTALSLCAVSPAGATGLATCDSGPKEGWQEEAVLQEQLEAEGWEIRRIKEDGGCYEVYAVNAARERVEAYFHPVTLERVPTEDGSDG